MSRPELLRARRVLPLRGPHDALHDGAVVLDGAGTILDLGAWDEVRRRWSDAEAARRDLGEVTLLPGVINAHCHLELSHVVTFKGDSAQGHVILGQGFAAWVASLLPHLASVIDDATLDAACAGLRAAGTTLVADVTSRHPRRVAMALHRAGLDGHLFLEGFGHHPLADEDRTPPLLPDDLTAISFSGMGHALYSTSPERMRARRDMPRSDARLPLPFCLHLAEHQDERECLLSGTGALADLLRRRVLPPDWTPPGVSPVRLARDLGLLGPATLAVHGVALDDADLAILRDSGTTMCLCPRSNEAIGVGRARVEDLRAAGVPLCLGTDGLCSAPDLDVLAELAWLLPRMAPAPGLLEALGWITVVPAALLGRGDRLGRLAPGRGGGVALLPASLEGWPL